LLFITISPIIKIIKQIKGDIKMNPTTTNLYSKEEQQTAANFMISFLSILKKHSGKTIDSVSFDDKLGEVFKENELSFIAFYSELKGFFLEDEQKELPNLEEFVTIGDIYFTFEEKICRS
jgi:hypothetical protein